MKLSIIVPCFNGEKTLEKCLDSLTACTYSPKEIIVVNDGSTDETERISKEYSEKYDFIFAYSKENEGLGKTRNFGIERSTGDLVTFVDADDYVEPEGYEKMISLMMSDCSDVVYCGFKYVFGKKIEEYSFTCKDLYDDTDDFIKYLLDETRCFAGQSACTGIYKSEIINKMAPPFLSEKEYLSEDVIFNVQYLRMAKRASVVNKSYYYYVQHQNGTITSSFQEKKFDAAGRMLRKLMENEHSAEIQQYILLDYLVNLSSLFQQLCMGADRKCKDKIAVIRKVLNSTDVRALSQDYLPDKIAVKFKIFYKMVVLRQSCGIYLMYSINSFRRKLKFRG